MIYKATTILLAIVMALAGWFMFQQSREISGLKDKVSLLEAQKAEAAIAAADATALLANKVLAAEKEGAIREKAALARAASATATANSLRRDIDVLEASIPNISREAVNKYAATAGRLLSDCGERYTGMAAKAQGHYLDTVKLQKAWPTNDRK